MSKTKEHLKRQNLRNNEYYNLQQTFDNLYEQSQNGISFKSIMKIITQEENILLAYRNIKKNKGSRTQGVDGKNIEFLANMTTKDLVSFIRKKLQNYFPKKVRRVEIPKPNGKTRPLGIPTIEDRLIQQCILQVLEPICETRFYRHSYGFRPLRSTKHAIARCYHHINSSSLYYVVDVDIKGFFDNIDHGKLLKQLWAMGIQDKSLLKVISKMLKAEIDGIGIPSRGTPQGGVLSPLLANVALNELDWWISSQWFDFKGRHPQTRCHKFCALKKTKLKEMFIVRYADDFKIFCRNYNDAKKTFIAVKEWLETRLHLEVSPEKSKITNLRKNCSEFLGIKLKTGKKKNIIVNNQLVNKYLSRSFIADKAKEKIIREIKFLTKRIQKSVGINTHKYINRYNAYMIGVHNYYNIATYCSKDFDDISSLCLRAFKSRLNLRKRKPGDKIPQYMNGYDKSEQLRFVLDRPLLPIGYVKYKVHPSFNGLSPYVEKDRNSLHKSQKAVSHEILRKIMSSPALYGSVEFNDNRLSLFVAQYGKCAVTGIKLEIDNIHCHHKTPSSLGGGDEYKNLVILHKEVHRLIHASTTATIKRYIESLGLNESKIEKVNSLRIKAQREPIL